MRRYSWGMANTTVYRKFQVAVAELRRLHIEVVAIDAAAAHADIRAAYGDAVTILSTKDITNGY